MHMQNELSSKFILSVFEKIRAHGTQQGSEYHLDGVNVSTDFDGYTLFFSDARVKLSFGFHNQYHYDYVKEDDRQQFESKLKHINENY